MRRKGDMEAKGRVSHRWDLTPAEAVALQRELSVRVVCDDRLGPVVRVGGADVGFEDGGRITRAAVVVLTLDALMPVEQVVIREPTRFPYVPGLLSFREVPALLRALDSLGDKPDLLLVDGHGIAHPRRLGIASHLGLVADLPTIGVAKSRLVGRYREPGPNKGDEAALHDGEAIIGSVLRTRTGVKPVYVSPGHRVSFATAVRYTLACTTRYRLPETTRCADRLASSRSRRNAGTVRGPGGGQ